MVRTEVLRIESLDAGLTAIRKAARVLREGGLVAFPTETVYGLGANALDEAAVQRIFVAKGRSSDDPIIVHLASADDLATVTERPDPRVAALGLRFWPGPLTLLVPRGARVPAVVTAGLPTLAVRVPDHPVALALLREARLPIAAPSANLFGHTSPTEARHVLADLEGRIDLVLDGGPTRMGIESTVLDLSGPEPTVLRPGAIPVELLREALGEDVRVAERKQTSGSPGMLPRHYAPRAEMVVYEGPPASCLSALETRARELLGAGKRVGLLLPDDDLPQLGALVGHPNVLVTTLGSSGALAEVANRLYAELRRLEQEGVDVILARTFGGQGLGLAISDRLRRAAAGKVVRL